MSTFYKRWRGPHFVAPYALALFSPVRRCREAFARLLHTLLAAVLGSVMLTIVAYDGRYRLPAELRLVPLAAAGLLWLRERSVARSRTAPTAALA